MISSTINKDFAHLKQAHSPVREGKEADSQIGEKDFCRDQDSQNDDIESA
jgi:hypothetical protein